MVKATGIPGQRVNKVSAVKRKAELCIWKTKPLSLSQAQTMVGLKCTYF